MKSAILTGAAILLLLLVPHALIAKGSGVGIYGVIDQVMFDREGSAPTLIRISGVFMIPVPMSTTGYRSPQRGFLYFQVVPGAEEAARKEWMQLKAVAGTGQIVGFAFYWVPNPSDPGGNPHRSLEVSLHPEGEAASPEDYPLPYPDGAVKSGDDAGRFDKGVVEEFKRFKSDHR
jgi:hypothetical protein